MLWVGAVLPALRALQGEAAGGISRGSGKLEKTTEAGKEGFRTTPYLLELVGALEKADLEAPGYPEPERRNCRYNSTNKPRRAVAGLSGPGQNYRSHC